jgi:GntR family transcriptional regulator, transcriptional repressor for pyruvate dehydrogenase complex
VTDEQLIGMLTVTTRTACQDMTDSHLAALADGVAQAEALPAKPYWDKKAVAHAAVIGMLGDATGDPVLMRLAGLAAGWTYDLAVAVGPSADGIILGSRRRLLAHLRAGDAEAAGQEIEKHLRVLSFMEQLFHGGQQRTGARRTPDAPRSAA